MLRLRRLSNALGAEVLDLNLSVPISPGAASTLRDAFLQHGVLLVRGQSLSPEQQIAFTRVFGDVDQNDAVAEYRHIEHPQIILITNEVRNGKPSPTRDVGRQWHTDHSHTLRPTVASVLHAKVLPEVGGDTMFANMYMAYETLSDGLKALLDPLWAVHDATNAAHIRKRDAETQAAKRQATPPVAQPVVRVHPESGRKALYVNEMLTRQFVGMTEAESRPLLEYLFAHAVQPEFCYRHQWRLHDLLIWDNRCMQHNALADFDRTQQRTMFRSAVAGLPSGYLVNVPLAA